MPTPSISSVMLAPWAWNEEPVTVWDTQDRPYWRDELREMVAYADEIGSQILRPHRAAALRREYSCG
jgi:hypothetical protein